MRRVVVTGLGAITPLGVGVRPTWRRLLAGDSGIVSAAHLEPQTKWRALPSPIAGLVPHDGWNATDWVSPADQRRMSRFSQYAVAATDMALRDAGWQPTAAADLEATGVCLGSGIGNLDDFYATSVAYEQDVRVQSTRITV
jgi:3-oxoacyl-[acyl-carrier-protein] synthase II